MSYTIHMFQLDSWFLHRHTFHHSICILLISIHKHTDMLIASGKQSLWFLIHGWTIIRITYVFYRKGGPFLAPISLTMTSFSHSNSLTLLSDQLNKPSGVRVGHSFTISPLLQPVKWERPVWELKTMRGDKPSLGGGVWGGITQECFHMWSEAPLRGAGKALVKMKAVCWFLEWFEWWSMRIKAESVTNPLHYFQISSLENSQNAV